MNIIDSILVEKIQITHTHIRLIATLISNVNKSEFQLWISGKEKYLCNLAESPVAPSNKAKFSFYIDVSIPLNETKFGFFVTGSSEDFKLLKCSFHFSVGLKNNRRNRFITLNQHIVKYSKGYFFIFTKTKKELIKRSLLSIQESFQKRSFDNLQEQILFLLSKSTKVNNSIGIISTRGNGKLTGNVASIIPFLNHPINYYLYDDGTFKSKVKLLKTLRNNKVVILDDYNYFLRKYNKNNNQKLIQLWHAAGAFKHFGKDGSAHIPIIDAEYHKSYDLVTASSEQIREIYANAFSIGLEKVLATGTARTDMMFNEKYKKEIHNLIYQKYPSLKNKEIILYAPTFRDSGVLKRSTFIPKFDFNKLSKSLNSNQVFVICPHPAMTDIILDSAYQNIFEIRDLSTSELMLCASLLITDYSSIIFDYSLLNKPIAFYCYDIHEYNRGFYLQYPDDLPGPMFTEENDLINYICNSNFTLDDKYKLFADKYMSACDGNSSERIANIVTAYMSDNIWL